MLVWNPLGLIALFSAASLLLVAAYVLYSRPGAVANQRLALLMLIEAFVIFAFSGGTFFLRDASVAWALTATGHAAVAFKLWAYLMFLATLPVPQVRLLRHPVTSAAILVATAAVAMSWFAKPGFFATTPVAHPGGGWIVPFGTGAIIDLTVWATIWALTLIFWLMAFRRATTVNARRLARGYLIGFGLRDLSFALAVAIFVAAPAAAPLVMGVFIPFVYAVYPWLVGYAILRHQLFDIQLRIRRVAIRSIAASIVIGLYFVLLQVASVLLSDRFGAAVAIVSAAMAALTIAPLYKGVQRAADAVWPTSIDLDANKLAVYRHAVAEWMAADGALDGRGKRELRRLREKMGFTDRDHQIVAQAIISGRASAGLWTPGQLILGRYTLLEPLGARVWHATDSGGNACVVKRSPRSTHEEKVLEIRHQNLVRMVDAGHEGEDRVLVLEHAGRALSDALPVGAAWSRLADDVLSGLAALHAMQVVHGDIKPRNVIVAADGRACLADFDVARSLDLEATMGEHTESMPVGTLRYMSPEQARGHPATKRSDVYGLAATLYEAIAGVPWLPVVAGESAHELRQRAARRRPPPRHLREAPHLRGWFATALAPDAEKRFGDAREMAAALKATLQMPVAAISVPDTRRSRRPV